MPSSQRILKRETVVFISFIAFAVGVLTGITYMVFRGAYFPEEKGRAQVSPMVGDTGAALAKDPEQLRALEGLKSRVQDHPDDAEAWIQLGNMYFDSGENPKAIFAYEKALAIKPEDPDVLTDLGIVYRREGQPQKAIKLFQEAQRSDPQHMNSLYNLGVVLVHDLNDIPGAVRAWEAYLRLRPNGPNADRVRSFLRNLAEEAAQEEPAS